MRASSRAAAFSLVELLVVIGIIAVLISILLPSLNKARRASRAASCLSNMRSMAIAQQLYANDNRGYLIQAGLAHNNSGANEDVAWINSLQKYYQNRLVTRCPEDESVHWTTPVPNSGGQQFRRTSYGINNFLDRDLCPWGPAFSVVPPGGAYVKLAKVRKSSAVIQFVEIAYAGPFAGSDHPHVENWAGTNIPNTAAKNMQINAHGGGRKPDWNSTANYSFLDGHAEPLRFKDAFESFDRNRFDPYTAQ